MRGAGEALQRTGIELIKMLDEQDSKESEAKRLERFRSITLEDVKCARDHLVAAPGDIVEIPVEYYDWLIGEVKRQCNDTACPYRR